MARFGKLPIKILTGAQINISGHEITVTGPKGALVHSFPRVVTIETVDQELFVKSKKQTKEALSLQGTTRSLVVNMITGVTEGWSKRLELVGTGFRAEVKGRDLVLIVGYSHPVIISAPEGITFAVEKNFVTVSGPDRQLVGHISALVRATRIPDPYKAKGVKYDNEVIRRKAGKQAAKTA